MATVAAPAAALRIHVCLLDPRYKILLVVTPSDPVQHYITRTLDTHSQSSLHIIPTTKR